MKIFSEYFNSGSVKQQNMKRLGGLLICITALLLVLTLVTLSVSSIVIVVKARRAAQNTDDPANTGTNILDGYTTTTFDGVYSIAEGSLLLLDASHSYTGSKSTVQPTSNMRAKDDNGNALYRGDYGEIHLTQETLDAFNALMLAFHEAKKDAEGYEIGRLYLDSNLSPKSATPSEDTKAVLAAGLGLILAEQALDSTENEVTIFDSEATRPTGKGVYAWIYENAHLYGFVRVSDAKEEGNIFRYVGIPHATYMKNNNKTLAEYLTYLRENKNAHNSVLNISAKDLDGNSVTYRVYYQAANAETAPIVPDPNSPKKYTYEVSGDNMGGYIITVNTTKKTK